MLSQYQKGRRTLLAARGVAVEDFADDQLTSADDIYFFPNIVGPIYPGIAILFRVRPNGLDPDSCIKDTWFLQWPQEGAPPKRAERRFSRIGPTATGARSPTRTTPTWPTCSWG